MNEDYNFKLCLYTGNWTMTSWLKIHKDGPEAMDQSPFWKSISFVFWIVWMYFKPNELVQMILKLIFFPYPSLRQHFKFIKFLKIKLKIGLGKYEF